MGIPISLSADFSAETLQARRERHDTFKVMKGKNPATKDTVPSKALIQILWRDQKQKFRTTKPALQEML